MVAENFSLNNPDEGVKLGRIREDSVNYENSSRGQLHRLMASSPWAGIMKAHPRAGSGLGT